MNHCGIERRQTRPVLNRVLAGVMVMAVVPVGAALAQDGSRIEAVTLSSGGLAEIRRSVGVDGATEFGFDVPLDQVDDVLKSLLVYDPAGGVAAMSLDGLSPVEETFRNLPFTPQDMGELPRLLGALQGIEVRVSSGGRAVEGMVLGVEAGREAESEGEEPAPLLSVMTGTGQVAVIRLRSDTELTILDEAMRENLRLAATVSGRGRVEDMRTLTLHLEGGGERDVRLDYVVAAPVWKTAYRLILDADGVARLQAWAVIENATGDDWSDVAVTLSSGAPVTLAQRLHERYWHARPEIPVLAQAVAPPAPDRYGEMAESMPQGGALFDTMRNVAVPASAPMPAPAPSAAAAQAQASEGETAAIYRLPTPVDLAAGQTLSVPFIDTELSGERIALFQPERGEVHPIAAIRLENTTGSSLPPGIVTFYAPLEEGYAGDAQIHNLPAGETRMISFAADRKVEVTTENGREEMVYRASLVDGVLRVTGTTRAATTYTIAGAEDAPRTVIIEHPRRNGWTFASDALEASTPTHHRLRVAVEAGGTARAVATLERTETDTISLVDMDAPTLLYWSGQLDDPETAQTLAELAERRQEIARGQTALADLQRELENAANSQARIRENLAAVPGDSGLAQRYLVQLEEQEDLIAELETRRVEAEGRLAELRAAFAEAVEAL
jgi:hypothetical protein